jgi:ABC-2 type transport system ATP-binding protein
MTDIILHVDQLTKQYKGGFQALNGINLSVSRGEIFALLGPNGAGKTTLISIVCGIVNPSGGAVHVDGHDILTDFRYTRSKIGLVPQELSTDMFETVWNTVSFSRELFGKAPNPARIEQILKDLSLWDKKDSKIRELSGGMKRRVMIAKALSHDPELLFLDEPTAGVDVELRRDMWTLVEGLRAQGVTVILTTHYIEEAEEMADRVGVIHQGQLILVEDKKTLMQRLGRKQLWATLCTPLAEVPAELLSLSVTLSQDGMHLCYPFSVSPEDSQVSTFFETLHRVGIRYRDVETKENSLEEIFVNLIGH